MAKLSKWFIAHISTQLLVAIAAANGKVDVTNDHFAELHVCSML